MGNSIVVRVESLPPAYAELTDFLSMEDILKLEARFKKQQIRFLQSKQQSLCKYPQLAQTLGAEKAALFAGRYAGEYFYFPEIKRMTQADRNQAIRDEFNGGNHAVLARKHNLSVRTVYRVLSNSYYGRKKEEGRQTPRW